MRYKEFFQSEIYSEKNPRAMKYGDDYYTGSLDDVDFKICRTGTSLTVLEECTNKTVESTWVGSITEELMEKEPLFFLTELFMRDSSMKIRLTVSTESTSPMR